MNPIWTFSSFRLEEDHLEKNRLTYGSWGPHTWQTFVLKSQSRTVWSRDPDMKLSFFGDIHNDTTLQEKIPF